MGLRIFRSSFGPALFLFLPLFLMFFFENCGVRTPQVEDATFLSVGFKHTGQETSCSVCHDSRRPVGATGPHGFSHIDLNFGGMNDCINCHTNKSNLGVTWAGGQFSHEPRPNSCKECHLNQRPTGLVGTPSFDHTLNGTGDCFGCHSKNTIAFNSLSDWAGGESTPTDLVGAKNISVSVGTPTFSHTTVSSVTTSTGTVPMQMLHSTGQVADAFINTCTNCHSGAGMGNFSGGQFHSALAAKSIAQPTACLECHVNAKPVGFVGPIVPQRSPASAEMRHEATSWSLNSNTGLWSATSNSLVTQDCATCHNNPGAQWSSAKYHPNLSSPPGSCLDCHANTRPVGLIGSPPFDHMKNGGIGNCATCHKVTNFTSMAGWANGNFPHTGVTSCASCHEGERPKSTAGWVATGWSSASTFFDLTKHGGATDCYACHKTMNFNTAADWNGGNFTHSPKPANCISCHAYPTVPVGNPLTNHAAFGGQDCLGCHTNTTNFTTLAGWAGASSTPAGLVNGDLNLFAWTSWTVSPVKLIYSGAKVTGSTTTANVKLPMQMLHASDQVPASMLNNCNACHKVGRVASSGTRFHASLMTQPASNCRSCHSPNGIPVGIVGPKSGSTDMTVNMDHASTYGSGAALAVAQDCSSCHKAPGATWTGANFHANIGANTLSSCTSCHYVKMPQAVVASKESFTTTTGVVMPQHFMHNSTMVTQDCMSCHLQKGPGPANPWQTSVKYHSLVAASGVTSCLDCHALDRPSTTTWYPSSTANRRYIHTVSYNGLGDCKNCHGKSVNTPYTNLNLVGTSWAGGLYNHKDSNGAKLRKPSCTSCHTGTGGDGFYDHDNAAGSRSGTMPCMTCHGTAAF